MKKYLPIVAKVFLAVPFLLAGLNKFFQFVQPFPSESGQAEAFLTTLFSSYLRPLVGVCEILGALLLFSKRTSFIGLLILLPIMVNILGFHAWYGYLGNGNAVVATVAFLSVCYVHRLDFKRLL